jgi:hypothetical protein
MEQSTAAFAYPLWATKSRNISRMREILAEERRPGPFWSRTAVIGTAHPPAIGARHALLFYT